MNLLSSTYEPVVVELLALPVNPAFGARHFEVAGPMARGQWERVAVLLPTRPIRNVRPVIGHRGEEVGAPLRQDGWFGEEQGRLAAALSTATCTYCAVAPNAN